MQSSGSAGRVTTGHLLVISAAMELGAGVLLLAAPSAAINLVFGASGIDPGIALGRIAGAALLSIAAACWWARHGGGARAIVSGLLVYNIAIAALVASSSLGSPTGVLWAIAALHATMAIWCAWSVRMAA